MTELIRLNTYKEFDFDGYYRNFRQSPDGLLMVSGQQVSVTRESLSAISDLYRQTRKQPEGNNELQERHIKLRDAIGYCPAIFNRQFYADEGYRTYGPGDDHHSTFWFRPVLGRPLSDDQINDLLYVFYQAEICKRLAADVDHSQFDNQAVNIFSAGEKVGELLIAAHGPLLKKHARRILNDGYSGINQLDLYHEAVIIMFQSIRTYKPEIRVFFSAYFDEMLNRRLRNRIPECSDYLYGEENIDNVEEYPYPSYGVLSLNKMVRLWDIEAAIDNLRKKGAITDNDIGVLEALYLHGFSSAEVGEALGKSSSGIWSRNYMVRHRILAEIDGASWKVRVMLNRTNWDNPDPETMAILAGLTARERQIVETIHRHNIGFQSAGNMLGIDVRTVQTTYNKVLMKLAHVLTSEI